LTAFIQTRLAQANLQPAPEADRRTLIRRVALDLTGIPPTPQEVAAFVNDKAANAYENLVDRLLNSDRYAEKAGHALAGTRCVTPTQRASTATMLFPRGRIAITCYAPFAITNRLTNSRANNWAGDLLPNATTENAHRVGL
jgi:hypothetical protein